MWWLEARHALCPCYQVCETVGLSAGFPRFKMGFVEEGWSIQAGKTRGNLGKISSFGRQ
ncbi:hypothetical protein R6G86_05835 [Actinotignum urinale]|uniref:Uncharacterized protein n=1 Tax=Actinotignum urinale TaxID=190146 RepID=A0ABU5G966_9ACTO|nr:hypothetical protein [Actinotignum urinale]